MAYTVQTATMMVDTVTDQAGNALTGQVYELLMPDGVTFAPVYTDGTATTQALSALLTDQTGTVTYFAKAGNYIRLCAGHQAAISVPVPATELDYLAGASATQAATAAQLGTLKLSGDLGGTGGSANNPLISDALRALITSSLQNTAIGTSVAGLTAGKVPTAQLPPFLPASQINSRPATETSYTTTNADLNNYIVVTNPAGETIVPHATAAAAFKCFVVQGGNGVVTINPGGNGATVAQAQGLTQTIGPGAVVTMVVTTNASGSNAQYVLTGDFATPTTTPGGPPPVTHAASVLDMAGIPAMSAWRSLRLAKAAYTGPLIRIARADTGAQLDIYPTATGDLDTVAIINFCGGQAANVVGTVVKLYDQTGNGRDWVAATTANQATIWTGSVITSAVAGGPPAMLMNANTNGYSTSSGTTYSGTTLTAWAVISYQGDSETNIPQYQAFWGPSGLSAGDTQGISAITRDGTTAPIGKYGLSRKAGAVAITGNATTGNVLDQVAAVIADPNYTLQVNGVITTATPTSGAIGAFGFTTDGMGHLTGSASAVSVGSYWSEGGYYQGALTQTQLDQIRANQSAYWGTPTPAQQISSNPAWTLVASDDFSTNTIANYSIYEQTTSDTNPNAHTTNTSTDHWRSSQVSINTTTKQLLLNATLDTATYVNNPAGTGTTRKGGGCYWNLPAAIFLYGAWEIDFYTDTQRGYAPVVLTWPFASTSWPLDGEIDILELYTGNITNTMAYGGESNLHLDTVAGSSRALKAPASNTNSSLSDVNAHSYQTDWTQKHTVRCEWQPTYIAIFIDGVLKAKTTDGSYIPSTKAHRLTIQQEFYGISDSSVTALNANTHITGVRAYTYSGGAILPASDATSHVSNNSASSLSWTHTVGGGLVNSIVIVGVAAGTTALNTPSVTGVTYGGTAMTPVPSGVTQTNGTDGHGEYLSLWYMLAPPSGAATVVATLSGGANCVGMGVSYQHVNQTTPFGTSAVAANNSTTNLSVNTTSSATTDKVFAAIVTRQNYATGGSGIGYVADWNNGQTYLQFGSKAGSGGTDTSSYTWSTANDGAMIAIPMKGA